MATDALSDQLVHERAVRERALALARGYDTAFRWTTVIAAGGAVVAGRRFE